MSRRPQSQTAHPGPLLPLHPLEREAWAGAFTLPNLLTSLRILLIPPFLALYLSNRLQAAALLFGLAAGTDLVDGLLARMLKQKSAVGAILDPLADKLLGLASLAALIVHGRLPLWLLGLSLTRDGVVLTLALAARARRSPLQANPTRIAKSATFFSFLAVILALAWEMTGAAELAGWVAAVALLAGECLLVAAVQYARMLARLPASA